MIERLRSNQSGAVSLITVMFMAILLTVVTTSFISITINEQQQAIDDDLTNRAFFAAESGVEDARIALDRYLNNEITEAQLSGDACDPPNFLEPEIENSDGIEASYTCQLINLVSPTYEAFVDGWSSRTIKIKGVDATGANKNFAKVTLNWHQPENDGAYALRADADIDLPEAPDWVSGGVNFPAMMRVHVTSYPTTGATFTSADARNDVFFVNPSTTGSINTTAFSHTGADGAIVSDSHCAAGVSSGYACGVSFNGFNDANRNYTIRVSALYSSTNVQLVLDDGATYLDGAQAVVDVTGRAGAVFRRVQARLSLDEADLLPDAAITSARDLCKQFNITDVADDPANIEGFEDVNFGPDPFDNPSASPTTLCQDP